jgi:hypothetical protein
MDLNLYTMEALARYQLEELRAGADVRSQLQEAARRRRPLRVVLGLTLIRLGTRALGPTPRPLARPL